MTIKRCENSFKCENNHSFDISKEGYVNLLSRSHKSGENTGDNRKMAVSRRDFLNKNYYMPLAQAISDVMTKYNVHGNALDICCGEGYYTQQVMQSHPDISYYGFDLSKEMVRLAAKRKCGANFFVANIADIPICDDSIDFAFHLFAPFHSGEFYRIMRQGGMLITVVPGSEHLYGLKELMYDLPVTEIHLRRLFQKYYHTTPANYRLKLRLAKIQTLLSETDLSFKEIADAVGMNHVTHLYLFLKRHCGMTPAELRKNLRM